LPRYGTLARLAGDVNPVDSRAASAVPPLPPIDSLDVWSLVTGVNNTSPRTVLPVDMQTILVGSHKFILTDPQGPHGVFVRTAGWTSPAYPNRTSLLPHRDASTVLLNCSAGCLFDVVDDPEERHELMASEPSLAAELRAQLGVLKRG
jgi:arylsulfatase B